ncbi:MAG TPA: hypothetical protein DIU35_08900 [Candidatus Latescibacteria bacterium]|nr:hypothetical protein [Gemmatimonadota bacterium]HCR17589.1 hypothetical protein [Candidatus Latescibacterota bacterium]
MVISTPHYFHEPLTVQAAEPGKHVICEKPIECTLGAGRPHDRGLS